MGQQGFPGVAGGRPREVDLAVRLLWIAFGLAFVVYVILGIFAGGPVYVLLHGYRSALHLSRTTLTTIALVSTVVYGLIAYALWAFLIVQLRAGRNWARITLAVVGCLSLLSSLVSLLVDFVGHVVVVEAVTDVFGLVARVLALVAIFLAFRQPAAPYFRRAGHADRAPYGPGHTR